MTARVASVLLLAIASTAAAQTRTIPADTVIRLQRTSCFGTCPAYTVTIDATGSITYEGERDVRVVGRETAGIAPASIARLLQVADRIQFFAQRDAYEGDITDLPTTYVSMTTGGRTKKIKDYSGAPPAGASPRGSTDIPAVECARRAHLGEIELRRRPPAMAEGRTALDDFLAVIALLEKAEQRR